MPDISMISTAFGSLKAATEIVKFLRDCDLSIERAEMKLKLADLVEALADMKIELVDLQDNLINKDKRIAELEEAFQTKTSLIRREDAYYEIDSGGNAVGIPFCLRCWENDHKKRQLVQDAKNYQARVCTSCGHQYNQHRAILIQPSAYPTKGKI